MSYPFGYIFREKIYTCAHEYARTRERQKMNSEHPVIIIDNREKTPLTFEHFPSRCGTLQSGDYSLAGHEGRFTVERKSVADLIGSLTAGREKQDRNTLI